MPVRHNVPITNHATPRLSFICLTISIDNAVLPVCLLVMGPQPQYISQLLRLPINATFFPPTFSLPSILDTIFIYPSVEPATSPAPIFCLFLDASMPRRGGRQGGKLRVESAAMLSTGEVHVRHGSESRDANSLFRRELVQRGIPVISVLGEKQGEGAGGGCSGIRNEGLGFRDEHNQRVVIHTSESIGNRNLFRFHLWNARTRRT
jgi:hypothetical protein